MIYTWEHTCTKWQEAESRLLGLKWSGFGIFTPPNRTGHLIVCYQTPNQELKTKEDEYNPESDVIRVFYRAWANPNTAQIRAW